MFLCKFEEDGNIYILSYSPRGCDFLLLNTNLKISNRVPPGAAKVLIEAAHLALVAKLFEKKADKDGD